MTFDKELFERKTNAKRINRLEPFPATRMPCYDSLKVRKAEGLYVFFEGYDEPFIDLVQGYSTTNWGHCHPDIVKAATQAIKYVDHVTGFKDPIHDQVCNRLVKGCGLNSGNVYFDVGGAQIVRLALHAAMVATGRHKTACLTNCFHGFGCVGARLTDAFLEDHIPRPECDATEVLQTGGADSLDRVRSGRFAALIVEPIQGAAGFQKLPVSWLKNIAEACQDSHTVLISDEIQVGLGRTGSFTAVEHADVCADMYLFGKALGGGIFPLSALVARPGILPPRFAESQGFGSTFSNNQFGMQIANATLDLLDCTLSSRDIQKKGDFFIKGLIHRHKFRNRIVCRAYGLAVAIDFDSSASASNFWASAFKEHIICHISGVQKDVIKVFPPLNLSIHELYDLGRQLGDIIELCLENSNYGN